jgi:hypothetical protein
MAMPYIYQKKSATGLGPPRRRLPPSSLISAKEENA